MIITPPGWMAVDHNGADSDTLNRGSPERPHHMAARNRGGKSLDDERESRGETENPSDREGDDFDGCGLLHEPDPCEECALPCSCWSLTAPAILRAAFRRSRAIYLLLV